MGAILQFAETLADGQDWTASERAQLRDVGVQLDGFDVVFGKSEAGDPWCVVTDDGGEVLLHVARIGGDFVVHATREDEVVQDDDLWTAAKRLLGDVLKERRGVLLAFPPEALGQTAVLAFLFAAAMRGEFDHWMPVVTHDLPAPSEAGGGTGIVDIPPAPADPAGEAEEARRSEPDAPSRGGDIREAARASAPDALAPEGGDDSPPPAAQADEAPATDRSPPTAQATGGVAVPREPDTGSQRGSATGGAQTTEVASFNAGGGSQGGGQTSSGAGSTSEAAPQAPLSEFVEGGDGDDRIAMSGNVAAVGGRGADTFVLALPTAVQGAPVLLGFVADFDSAEGDRLEVNGRAVMVVDRTETDLLSAVRTHPGGGGGSGVAATLGGAPGGRTTAITDSAPIMNGRHIGYDLNGDGKEDAYVLVTGSGGTWFSSVRPAAVNAGGPVMGGPPSLSSPIPGATGSFLGAEAPIGITAEPLSASAGKDFLF